MLQRASTDSFVRGRIRKPPRPLGRGGPVLGFRPIAGSRCASSNGEARNGHRQKWESVARLSDHQRRIGSFAAAEAYWRHYGQRHHRRQQHAGSARRTKDAGRTWYAKPNIVTATIERRERLTAEVVPFRPQVRPRVPRRGSGRPAGSRRAPRVAGRGGDSGDSDGPEGEPGEARHLTRRHSNSLAVEQWSWSS
jgi:hypothetical protein